MSRCRRRPGVHINEQLKARTYINQCKGTSGSRAWWVAGLPFIAHIPEGAEDDAIACCRSAWSRDTATRTLTASGDRHRGGSAILVLSFADLLEVESRQLKEHFLRCMLTPEVECNARGLLPPPLCHGHHGRALITKIMEANAIPCSDVFYHCGPRCPHL